MNPVPAGIISLDKHEGILPAFSQPYSQTLAVYYPPSFLPSLTTERNRLCFNVHIYTHRETHQLHTSAFVSISIYMWSLEDGVEVQPSPRTQKTETEAESGKKPLLSSSSLPKTLEEARKNLVKRER
jgi:hypothetical protein